MPGRHKQQAALLFSFLPNFTVSVIMTLVEETTADDSEATQSQTHTRPRRH